MTEQVQPIKPGEVAKQKSQNIPPEVIAAFNELIIKKFQGGRAYVTQNEVVELIVAKGLERQEVFAKHWLDVEGIFQEEGWTVVYDKPAWCESYNAHFVFSVKSVK
jgi:hypothetical protein